MKNLVNISFIILVVAVSRLIPHWPNLTAIGASAIWMGYAWPKKSYAVFVPIAALFLSDALIGFHNQMIWVYGSVLISSLAIQFLGIDFSPKTVLKYSLLNTVLFFVITNFGVWYAGGLYPLNFAGLIESYVAALPFAVNDFLGNSLYGTIGMLVIQKINAFKMATT